MENCLLVDTIKNATHNKYHQKLESSPYANLLKNYKLPIESYVGHIRAMAIIHGVLEHEIRKTRNKTLLLVWTEEMQKYPLLEKDMIYFFPQWIKDIPESFENAQSLAKNIRLRVESFPESLIGYLYVLEGSSIGAKVIKKDLIFQFPFLENKGDHYLSSYGDDTLKKWENFKQRVNSIQIEPSQKQMIIEAACEIYEGIIDIFQSLYPLQMEKMKYLSVSLNPEAGAHPIPQDVKEIQASIQAGEKCMDKFPYQKIRFGERGRKFAHSDSAWLATLVNLKKEEVIHQVKWLKRVLSNRGLPSYMLQVHLEILHDELCKLVPEKQKEYEKLKIAAEEIYSFRQSYMNEHAFSSLSKHLTSDMDKECFLKTGLSASLLASAIIDEKAGIGNTVQNILKWVTDSQVHFVDAFQSYIKRVSSLITT